MKKKPLIYVAGPIGSGSFDNLRNAIRAALTLKKLGALPLVPHTHGFLIELVESLDREFWMELSLELVGRSDGVLRIPGGSPGADEEVEYARSLNTPVWFKHKGDGTDRTFREWIEYCGKDE